MAPTFGLLGEQIIVEGGNSAVDVDAADEAGKGKQQVAFLVADVIDSARIMDPMLILRPLRMESSRARRGLLTVSL